MRFLLDANLSRTSGCAVHGGGVRHGAVADVGLLTALDSAIFDYAAAEGYVVITADTDFSMLLAARRTARLSVVLLRHVAELRPDAHAELLAANLPAVMDELQRGAVVSLSPSRLSIRRLPITSRSESTPAVSDVDEQRRGNIPRRGPL